MSHAADPVAAVALLRGDGAQFIDPVRLHFLEALARRIQGHEGAVKRLLEDKLSRALAAVPACLGTQAPDARDVQRLAVPPQPSALAELTRALTRDLPSDAQATMHEDGNASNPSMGYRPELKSLRYFRETWAKLSVDKQLTLALEQGPQNAGPLNSHQLVLRALSVMRDISPDYLHRFMSYADALLWLDLADNKPVVKSISEKVKRRYSPPAKR